MDDLGSDATAAAPVLLQCLNDPNPAISQRALRALSRHKLEPKIVVPLLTKELDSTSEDARLDAILELKEFGPEAILARPSLLRIVSETNLSTTSGLREAVSRIARETLAKMPMP
jgi:HEAT repeat protein